MLPSRWRLTPKRSVICNHSFHSRETAPISYTHTHTHTHTVEGSVSVHDAVLRCWLFVAGMSRGESQRASFTPTALKHSFTHAGVLAGVFTFRGKDLHGCQSCHQRWWWLISTKSFCHFIRFVLLNLTRLNSTGLQSTPSSWRWLFQRLSTSWSFGRLQFVVVCYTDAVCNISQTTSIKMIIKNAIAGL